MSARKSPGVHRKPELVASDAWIAPGATVIGNVHLAAQSSVWYGAVLRGDVERIEVGQASNVQDLSCLHADPGFPCVVGDRVTIGHGAIVHGATVQSDCLIGIRATILNGAVIGTGSIIAAGSLVPEGKTIPPHSLVMGTPGRVVRQVTKEDAERIRRGTEHYVAAAAQHAGRTTTDPSDLPDEQQH